MFKMVGVMRGLLLVVCLEASMGFSLNFYHLPVISSHNRCSSTTLKMGLRSFIKNRVQRKDKEEDSKTNAQEIKQPPLPAPSPIQPQEDTTETPSKYSKNEDKELESETASDRIGRLRSGEITEEEKQEFVQKSLGNIDAMEKLSSPQQDRTPAKPRQRNVMFEEVIGGQKRTELKTELASDLERQKRDFLKMVTNRNRFKREISSTSEESTSLPPSPPPQEDPSSSSDLGSRLSSSDLGARLKANAMLQEQRQQERRKKAEEEQQEQQEAQLIEAEARRRSMEQQDLLRAEREAEAQQRKKEIEEVEVRKQEEQNQIKAKKQAELIAAQEEYWKNKVKMDREKNPKTGFQQTQKTLDARDVIYDQSATEDDDGFGKSRLQRMVKPGQRLSQVSSKPNAQESFMENQAEKVANIDRARKYQMEKLKALYSLNSNQGVKKNDSSESSSRLESSRDNLHKQAEEKKQGLLNLQAEKQPSSMEGKSTYEREEQATYEAEEKSIREAEERAIREAKEQRFIKEEQAIREAEAEEQRLIMEEQAMREAEEQRRIMEEEAMREAEEQRRIMEEQAMREAEEQHRIMEEKAMREAERQYRIMEEIAMREAEEKRRIMEEKATREAEEQQQRKEIEEEEARKEKARNLKVEKQTELIAAQEEYWKNKVKTDREKNKTGSQQKQKIFGNEDVIDDDRLPTENVDEIAKIEFYKAEPLPESFFERQAEKLAEIKRSKREKLEELKSLNSPLPAGPPEELTAPPASTPTPFNPSIDAVSKNTIGKMQETTRFLGTTGEEMQDTQIDQPVLRENKLQEIGRQQTNVNTADADNEEVQQRGPPSLTDEIQLVIETDLDTSQTERTVPRRPSLQELMKKRTEQSTEGANININNENVLRKDPSTPTKEIENQVTKPTRKRASLQELMKKKVEQKTEEADIDMNNENALRKDPSIPTKEIENQATRSAPKRSSLQDLMKKKREQDTESTNNELGNEIRNTVSKSSKRPSLQELMNKKKEQKPAPKRPTLLRELMTEKIEQGEETADDLVDENTQQIAPSSPTKEIKTQVKTPPPKKPNLLELMRDKTELEFDKVDSEQDIEQEDEEKASTQNGFFGFLSGNKK